MNPINSTVLCILLRGDAIRAISARQKERGQEDTILNNYPNVCFFFNEGCKNMAHGRKAVLTDPQVKTPGQYNKSITNSIKM